MSVLAQFQRMIIVHTVFLLNTTSATLHVQSSVPTAAPGDVSAKATSFTSLLITWSGIPKQHRHGQILMHHVYVSPANMPSDVKSFPAARSNELHLDDLQTYTLYVIRVSARSNIGEGPKSAPITARTMEGSKLLNNFQCSFCFIVLFCLFVLRDIWFVSSTGQTCPEGRSTNRTRGPMRGAPPCRCGEA